MKGWRKYPVIYETNTWVWLSELNRTQGKTVILATVTDYTWTWSPGAITSSR